MNILDQERFLGLRHRTNLHSFGAARLWHKFYESLISQYLGPRFEQVFLLGVAADKHRRREFILVQHYDYIIGRTCNDVASRLVGHMEELKGVARCRNLKVPVSGRDSSCLKFWDAHLNIFYGFSLLIDDPALDSDVFLPEKGNRQ